MWSEAEQMSGSYGRAARGRERGARLRIRGVLSDPAQWGEEEAR